MPLFRKEHQPEPVKYTLNLATLDRLDDAMQGAFHSRIDFNLLLRYANHTPIRHAKEPMRDRTLPMDINEDISYNIKIAKKELKTAETLSAKKQVFQNLLKRLKELLEDHLTDKKKTPEGRRLQWNVTEFHAEILKDLEEFISQITIQKIVMEPTTVSVKANL
jgi:hypothetical protein